jgi:signal transduction histidine kinase/CheY-like chemotaxis protein
VIAAVGDALTSRLDFSQELRIVSGGRERWVTMSGRGRYEDGGRLVGMFGVVQEITADRLLVRVDDAVRPLTDAGEITFTAARLLGQHLSVNRCTYATVDTNEDTYTVSGNYTWDTHSIVGRYRFSDFGGEFLQLMRDGMPFIASDAARDPRLRAGERAVFERFGARAVLCMPIRKSERLVAAMALHTTAPREWQPAEIALVRQVSGRCWESIERARVLGERATLLEAAQAANRAKDEFLAMLGHELRNPLAPNLTAIQLMKLRGDNTSARERTVIERQVNHLTRLVDDLLDVSRIARGKVELKTELVEVAEFVGRAIEVASPLLEERSHTLTVNIPASGLAVEGDSARLSQVVSNLLTNAAKYTPAAGKVSVSAVQENGEVVLRVLDSGIGIPPEVLPRVFDLFVQAPQAIDRANGGLGLGLTIVRSLVERHRGRIAVYSEGPGRGSEFVVRLPIAASAGRPRLDSVRVDLPRLPVPGAGRILIVDDNGDAAEMLSEVLRTRGYDTRVAHDGPKALEIAAGFLPTAAFLDIGLPVMDGFELAARLRELPGLDDIRLIAVTGYGQPADRERTALAGFDYHIVKPVDFELLQQVVGTARSASAPR